MPYFDTVKLVLTTTSNANCIEISQRQYDECSAAVTAGASLLMFNGDILIKYPTTTMTVQDALTAQIDLLTNGNGNPATPCYLHDSSLPITYNGSTFQADERSRSAIAGILSAGSLPTTFPGWYDINNVAVNLTYAQLQALCIAMQAQEQTAMARLQARKAAARTAATGTTATVAAVQAVVW